MGSMKTMLATVLVGCLVLAGCASGPMYRPAPTANDYGYRDSALTGTRYQVSFAAGYGVAVETVRKLALLRAAQVALIHGSDRFQVVSRETNNVTTGGSLPMTSFGYGYPFWGVGVGFVRVPHRTRYETVLEIEVGSQVPLSGADVYDAASVKQHLLKLAQPPTDR